MATSETGTAKATDKPVAFAALYAAEASRSDEDTADGKVSYAVYSAKTETDPLGARVGVGAGDDSLGFSPDVGFGEEVGASIGVGVGAGAAVDVSDGVGAGTVAGVGTSVGDGMAVGIGAGVGADAGAGVGTTVYW